MKRMIARLIVRTAEIAEWLFMAVHVIYIVCAFLAIGIGFFIEPLVKTAVLIIALVCVTIYIVCRIYEWAKVNQ